MAIVLPQELAPFIRRAERQRLSVEAVLREHQQRPEIGSVLPHQPRGSQVQGHIGLISCLKGRRGVGIMGNGVACVDVSLLKESDALRVPSPYLG